MAITSDSPDSADIKSGEYILTSAALLLGAVMFGRLTRPILIFAAGMTAARGLWGTEAKPQGKTRSTPEWLSDHQPGPTGHLTHSQKTDLAMENSFPASDPPSTY